MSTTPVPYSPPYMKVSDRKINVAMKIGNRQDLLQPAPGSAYAYSRISGWLRDAYIAIATCRDFEQTEVSMQFQTVAGQDIYTFPGQARAIKALTGYDLNNTPIIVNWTDITSIRRYAPAQTSIGNQVAMTGRPSLYTYWGNSILFRPVPDNTYVFYVDYWERPLITKDVDSTPLKLPDEWLEVVDYEAAVRGNAELQQADKSREMQEMLNGFSDPTTGRYVPGMIEKLQNRKQATAPYVDYGLKPQSGKTGYTR